MAALPEIMNFKEVNHLLNFLSFKNLVAFFKFKIFILLSLRLDRQGRPQHS